MNVPAGCLTAACRSTTAADVKPEDQTRVELNEPVSLNFALKYLVSFSRASALSGAVQMSMSRDLPIVVEYPIAGQWQPMVVLSFQTDGVQGYVGKG
jgi:proliferating cell nuclear antigen